MYVGLQRCKKICACAHLFSLQLIYHIVSTCLHCKTKQKVWIHVLDNVVYSVISFGCVLYVCVCGGGGDKILTNILHTCDTFFPVHVWPEARNIHQVMLQVGGRTPQLPGATCTPGFHSHWKSKGICFVELPRCTLVHWDIKQSCQSGPDCRKQSQEMEMHCVTTSTTLGYLFGQISPFFSLGIPSPGFLLVSQWWCVSAGGKKKQEKKRFSVM